MCRPAPAVPARGSSGAGERVDARQPGEGVLDRSRRFRRPAEPGQQEGGPRGGDIKARVAAQPVMFFRRGECLLKLFVA